MIFWNIALFEKCFDSTQVKRWLISSKIHFVHFTQQGAERLMI